MTLKSVDNPQPQRSPFESFEAAPQQPKEVLGATSGQADQTTARATTHFIVKGKRQQPLRQPSSPFESILGDVDRRKQILETDLTPWRMICSLEIVGQNGLNYIGTGWLAAPRTVVTAGHCVFDPGELGGWAQSIKVVPGRNGSDKPLDIVESSSFSTTDRWQASQDPDFDYAAIHLDKDLGTKLGTFGMAVLPDADLTNRLVNVSGYPVSPGNGELQYFHANRVNAITGRRLFYDIDTIGGQSGSPVWAYLDGSDDPVVVAIHAYGLGGVPANLHVRANSGPRILVDVLEVIKEWIKRGTP